MTKPKTIRVENKNSLILYNRHLSPSDTLLMIRMQWRCNVVYYLDNVKHKPVSKLTAIYIKKEQDQESSDWKHSNHFFESNRLMLFHWNKTLHIQKYLSDLQLGLKSVWFKQIFAWRKIKHTYLRIFIVQWPGSWQHGVTWGFPCQDFKVKGAAAIAALLMFMICTE